MDGGGAAAVKRRVQNPFQVQSPGMSEVPDGRAVQPPDFIAGISQTNVQVRAFAIAGDFPLMSQLRVKAAGLQSGGAVACAVAFPKIAVGWKAERFRAKVLFPARNHPFGRLDFVAGEHRLESGIRRLDYFSR